MNQEKSTTISLVITVYNRQNYLTETIETVIQQTSKNWELLIWDDGSTDDSVKIANHYAQLHPQIRVIAAPHLGRGPALAKAIAQTKGAYLGWVDSDDKLSPTALAETAAILDTQPSVGLVYTDYLVIDETGVVRGNGKRCQIPYSPERLLLDFMTFHFRLIRRCFYNQVGGIDPQFQAAGDYDLCLRLSEVTRVYHLRKPLYLYRHHQNNISHSQQFEQIHFTHAAITKALERRGLADQIELQVQVRPKFFLRRKNET